ncbi:HlyD family type I secretion periplasmic adaptor subunit [Methylobacterium oryzihabitans]|uniref:Membrane fusion protein (MFP) family protein n=1 Tax=Methylobacterium oryzihabitans TaxID=2499852 RepID=A0A3S2YJM4_9HYPH|nr:HlyD family type I secretion periplasmic adaptor subunit [Methylobacterium oryzihabitans]RVU12478.1 HlyD family type I secretion periplasmic adaptor subunit [Methylobacterium oryzihabitans]
MTTPSQDRAIVSTSSSRPANVGSDLGLSRKLNIPPSQSIIGKIRRISSTREDQEFLPAHLEILDTPPSPYVLVFTWCICIMFATSIIWSCIAKIDIHAVATGRIQPSGRSKVVQPFEAGKIQALYVSNGNKVNAGDTLAIMETTEADADLKSRKSDLATMKAQVARRQATIVAVQSDSQKANVKFENNIPSEIKFREESAMNADIYQYLTTRDAFVAQLNEKIATQKRFIASISAREKLFNILKERADMRETLVAKAAGTRAAVIDALQQVEQVSADLAYDRGQLMEAQAAAVSLEKRIDQLKSETVSKQYQSLVDAQQKVDTLTQDVVKAENRKDRMYIKSPIEGTIQQLAVTTIGQVVTAGQPLMIVVPSDGEIELEAQVANKDIGFILQGQEVIIKIDAFPFTRYGTLEGRVLRVSRDAVDEKDLGGSTDAISLARGQGLAPVNGTPKTQNLVFPVTISISQHTILADGQKVPLTPGMTATVEIRTGSRRVIDYILSPLSETVSTAGRER